MVDWMGDDNLSYCRVVLSCHKYERVKYNIVIVLRILYLLKLARVLELGFWSLGFWSLDLYIKSESLLIVFIHCEIILDRYLCEDLLREDSASWSLVNALLVLGYSIGRYSCTCARPSPSKHLLEAC